MHIDAINNNFNTNSNNLHFGRLIKDKSVRPIIKSMSESDRLEFKQIEKRFAKSKFWDVKISGIGDKFKEFKFKFIDKKNKNNVITEGIHPYNQKDNTIKCYSIIYGPENAASSNLETLQLKSEKRAKELFDQHHQNNLYTRNLGYNVTPLESLKMKEIELRMLEESSQITQGKHKVSKVDTNVHTKSTTGNNFSIDEKIVIS
ncbi:MAG: hypothetical protein K6E29_07045 [Cyanobacteria bacterium RUI128]|nr:hypothetical protein [Cyanobacteria bacterium RUI128]